MKTKPTRKLFPCANGTPELSHVKQNRGVALLIVLGMLVLLSVIVLAFVESVTKDLADSNSYAQEVTTRMLADSALNLVEMEIRAASTGTTSAGTNLAWISQPGLLRTYDSNGSAVAAYKLYSSSQMVVPGSFDPSAGTDLPTSNTWLNQPNLYTDLNSPVASGTTTSGSTNYIFPIIDGNDIKSISVSGSQQLTYTTDGVLPTVEGFATAPSKVGINYQSGVALSATNNPVPMPVQWLYMLKDGTLIPASAVGNSKDVTFNGTILPSGTNPIVARIAFWTDDESCKVNINTASEGTFWDTPVCVTQPNVSDAGDPDPQGKSVFDPNQIFEWDLAQRQPDRNEYQRYPGHPATTCLSPVLGDTIFKNLGLTRSGTGAGYHGLLGPDWAQFTEFINQLAPRVSGMNATATSYTTGTSSDFSSKGGTYRAGGPGIFSGNLSANIGSGTAITPDQDRLYADVDEYFYSGTYSTSGTNRAFNGAFMTGSNVSTSGTIVPVLTPSLLSKSRFFLTASSNAPELNVFNMPRVCMWPITKTLSTLDNVDTSQSTVTATMTAFDKVIAFCATLGMNGQNTTSGTIPFYFVRYDPFSQTADFANSQNNQNLYNYLHNFMGKPFPGLSASSSATLVAKYPAEDIGTANQILTEIYDYIRCTNLADISEDTGKPYGAKSYTKLNPTLQFTDQPWMGLTNLGQVVPIVIPTSAVSGTQGVNAGTPYTRGIGRIIMPGEMTMEMVKEDERINSGAAENATANSIIVGGTSQYSGTWNFSASSGTTIRNYQNVLIKDPSKKIYAPPYPNSHQPPTTDQLLLPGAGGLAVSGTNLYDPRSQTKIQVVLAPFYFCPMAGWPAIANNIRYHWQGVNLTFTGTDGTQATAVAPSASGTYASGTQGQDLYDSGRVEQHNSMESHIGGPMGPKSLIDPQRSSVIPSNTAAPADSMYQSLEVVVTGTSTPAGSFSGSSPNTMQVAGTGTLQIMAPAVPMSWPERGITNDPVSVIQTIVFNWPSTKVQIPELNTQGAQTYPFVGLQSGQTGSNSTLSGNPATAEALIISATNSGSNASQVTVKSGTSRLAPGGQYDGGYSSWLMFPNATMQDVVRSLPLGGILPKSGVGIAGDFRLAAASGSIPAEWYQPIKTYSASGTSVPVIKSGQSYVTGSFTSGSLTPYYDQNQQYAYGWRSAIFYGGVWFNASPPGQLIATGSTGNVVSPLYMDNRYSPYVPTGVSGVYNYLGSPGDWDNGPGWLADGAYCNKPDEGWVRHFNVWPTYAFSASSIAPFIGHAFNSEDSALGLPSLYAPNKMVSSPVMFGSLPTGVLAQDPWQTLLFRPAKSYLPGGAKGASGNPSHPGAAVGGNGGLSPGDGVLPYPPYSKLPDHAILDLFWMPVVDPYPISEPFATSGKVNLNYQIAPFTYITRNTALRAVLQSVKITAMNPSTSDNITPNNPSPTNGLPSVFSVGYKIPGSNGNPSDNNDWGIGNGGCVGICVRRNIDLDSTIKQIDVLRFGTASNSVNKPFITASEICDVPLIPADLPNVGSAAPYNIASRIKSATPDGYDAILADFWYGSNSNSATTSPPQFGHRLTGDNSLEKPYSMIYPRLTTKSNTFTVHVRVQTIKKSPNTPATLYKDGVDQVTGEFRGSYVIERYLDPGTAGFYSGTTPVSFSSIVTNSNSGAQVGPYKFRVVSSKQFGQ